MSSEPVVLVGETRAARMREMLRARGWGRMWTVGTPSPEVGEPWGFDNGAFGCYLAGMPFDSHSFLCRLDRADAAGIPMVAVVPDIVQGGLWSLEFSLDWRERLREDWSWYLAVQDGMLPEDVSPCLDRFAGIFLGGTTRFKATAAAWRDLARQHEIKFHYGRAGTINRLSAARVMEADSLDTAFPLWTYERMTSFLQAFIRPPYDGQFAIGPGAVRPRR